MTDGANKFGGVLVSIGVVLFVSFNGPWGISGAVEQQARLMFATNSCVNVTGSPDLRKEQCDRQNEFVTRRNWFETWLEDTQPGMRYFSSVGLVYCHIAQNGLPEYKRLILRSLGDSHWNDSNVSNVLKAYSKKKLIEKEGKAAKMLLDPEIPKLVITRNPVTRTLSAFLGRSEYMHIETDDSPGAFREWVQTEFGFENADIMFGLSCETNVHWRPQICRCGLLHTPLLFTLLRIEKESDITDFIYQVFPHNLLSSGWGTLKGSWRQYIDEKAAYERIDEMPQLLIRYFDVVTFDMVATRLAPDIETLDYTQEVAKMRKTILAATENSTLPYGEEPNC